MSLELGSVDINSKYDEVKRVYQSNPDIKKYNKEKDMKKVTMLSAIRQYRVKNREKPFEQTATPKQRKRHGNQTPSSIPEFVEEYRKNNDYHHILHLYERKNIPFSVLIYDHDVSTEQPLGVGIVTSFSHPESGDVFLDCTLGVNNEHVKNLITKHCGALVDYQWIGSFPNIVGKHSSDSIVWEASEIKILTPDNLKLWDKWIPKEEPHKMKYDRVKYHLVSSTTSTLPQAPQAMTSTSDASSTSLSSALESTTASPIRQILPPLVSTSSIRSESTSESVIIPPPPALTAMQKLFGELFPGVNDQLSLKEQHEQAKDSENFQEKFEFLLFSSILQPAPQVLSVPVVVAARGKTGRKKFLRTGLNCMLKAFEAQAFSSYPHPVYGPNSCNFSSLSSGNVLASSATIFLNLVIEHYDYCSKQGVNGYEAFVNYLVPILRNLEAPPPSSTQRETDRKASEKTFFIWKTLLKRIRGIINGFTSEKERNIHAFVSCFFGDMPAASRFETVVAMKKKKRSCVVQKILTDPVLGEKLRAFAKRVCMDFDNLKGVKKVTDFEYANSNRIQSSNPYDLLLNSRTVNPVTNIASYCHMYPVLQASWENENFEGKVTAGLYGIQTVVLVTRNFNGRESSLELFKNECRMNSSFIRLNENDKDGGKISNCDISAFFHGVRPSGYLINILLKLITSNAYVAPPSMTTELSSSSSPSVSVTRKLFFSMETTNDIMTRQEAVFKRHLEGQSNEQSRVGFGLMFFVMLDFHPYLIQTKVVSPHNPKKVEVTITNMMMNMIRIDFPKIFVNLLYFIRLFYSMTETKDCLHIVHNRFDFFQDEDDQLPFHQNIIFGILAVAQNWYSGNPILDLVNDPKAVQNYSVSYRTHFLSFLHSIFERSFDDHRRNDEDEDDDEEQPPNE